jgi:outer membrane lipoprotein-sorting protein
VRRLENRFSCFIVNAAVAPVYGRSDVRTLGWQLHKGSIIECFPGNIALKLVIFYWRLVAMNVSRSLFAACLLFICLGNPSFAQTAPLSGSAILAKSAAAYDALTSYSCYVEASNTSDKAPVMSANADISFVRPGSFSAAGASMGNTPYSYVTNGKAHSVTANGSTNSVADNEMGLATVTGLSLQAPTIIGALLLHTKWGSPFVPDQTLANKVTVQNVEGHKCYEVDVLTPIKRAFWIDAKTFLIVQIATKMDAGALGSFHFLQTVTTSKINPTIPESTFTVPE